MQLYDITCRECSKLTTKNYSSSFASAINLLHKNIRQPVYDIYGFVRFADEIVDTFHDHDKAALLQAFKTDTYAALDNKISTNPILHAFQITVNEYAIDRKLIDAFLTSMEMDLHENAHTKNSYNTYIYGSAEVVGLMCLQVFCERDVECYDKLKPYAQSLGAAFQKVNFLRDIKADKFQLNRFYFPGCNFNNFSIDDKRLVEQEVQQDFEHAFKGIKLLPVKARFGVYVAYKYYYSLFKKIRSKKPQIILQKRTRIHAYGKAYILAKAFVRNGLNML